MDYDLRLKISIMTLTPILKNHIRKVAFCIHLQSNLFGCLSTREQTCTGKPSAIFGHRLLAQPFSCGWWLKLHFYLSTRCILRLIDQ